MKLTECRDWTAVHFIDRTVLIIDRDYYPDQLWQNLLTMVEVEPMGRPGHYKAI